MPTYDIFCKDETSFSLETIQGLCFKTALIFIMSFSTFVKSQVKCLPPETVNQSLQHAKWKHRVFNSWHMNQDIQKNNKHCQLLQGDICTHPLSTAAAVVHQLLQCINCFYSSVSDYMSSSHHA